MGVQFVLKRVHVSILIDILTLIYKHGGHRAHTSDSTAASSHVAAVSSSLLVAVLCLNKHKGSV